MTLIYEQSGIVSFLFSCKVLVNSLLRNKKESVICVVRS